VLAPAPAPCSTAVVSKVPRTHSGYFREHPTPMCDECGFALEGLPPEGNCPECGTPFTLESSARLRRPPTVAWALLDALGPWLLLPLALGLLIPSIPAIPLPIAAIACVALVFMLALRSARYLSALQQETLPRRTQERHGMVAASTLVIGCLGIVMAVSASLVLLILIVMLTGMF
jgi:hypothetical protein